MRWDLILPNPIEMYRLFVESTEYYLENWWSTFWISLIASLLALGVSFVASVAGLRFPIVSKVVSPITTLSQSFPLQAIAPLIVIAFGVGFHSKLAIAGLIAFFPIYISMATALKHTPRAHMAHLKVTQARFWDGVKLVRIPIALPSIVASTKIGFTLAVLGAVVAEFIQPQDGLGRIILLAQSQFEVNAIYICVSLLIIQGLVIFYALSRVEAQLLRTRTPEFVV